MTDRPRRRRRLPKRVLRALAWVTGGVAFFSPWTVLGLSPKPAAGEATKTARASRQVIVVKKITRKVIIQDVVTAAPVSSVSSTSSGGSAAVAAPVTTTSGSTPPP
jgi:hypothetical protein